MMHKVLTNSCVFTSNILGSNVLGWSEWMFVIPMPNATAAKVRTPNFNEELLLADEGLTAVTAIEGSLYTSDEA